MKQCKVDPGNLSFNIDKSDQFYKMLKLIVGNSEPFINICLIIHNNVNYSILIKLYTFNNSQQCKLYTLNN